VGVEVEVSRGFLRSLFLSLTVIGLTVLGVFSSPRAEDGRPMLLTPQLARVIRYQRTAQKWILRIEEVNAELAAILEQTPTDLFSQDQGINRVYGWLVALREEMDGTEVPPTLENLHTRLTDLLAGYLDATSWTAQWASEPTEENHFTAIESWYAASRQLQAILGNPWLQVGP